MAPRRILATIIASTLIGAHNIQFYHDLMSTMRAHILADTFAAFYSAVREKLAASDDEYPIQKPRIRQEPVKPMELGDYEVLVSREGISRIRHKSSGETMHPHITPEEEARDLYVGQSQFTRRIAEQESLVLWDVGMGACANVMAAIHAFEDAAAKGLTKARLHVVSFEHDLDSLRLANQHLDRFTYLRHGAPARGRGGGRAGRPTSRSGDPRRARHRCHNCRRPKAGAHHFQIHSRPAYTLSY